MKLHDPLPARMTARLSLLVAALALLGPSTLNAERVYLPKPDSRPVQPVIDAQLYDVHVLNAEDGHYYLTGTWIGQETRIPLWRSTNLRDWSFAGTLIESAGQLSAPELYQRGEWFYLLLTEKEGITLYRSEHADHGFVHHARLAENVTNASLFFDGDSAYLVYGGGYLAPLADDLGSVTGPARFLHPSFDLPRPEAPGWATEKAQMLRVGTEAARILKANGRYYLFASEWITRLNDTIYDMLCASSESLTGPYTARRLAFMHAGGGSIFQARDGAFHCAFSGQAVDRHLRVTRKPVITPVDFILNGESMGYTGDFYFEQEPVGNLRNRMPDVTMRDPSICRGPDGWYYMVHTENWVDIEFGKPRILLRRSRDLLNWEDLNHLVRTEDLGLQVDGSPLGFEDGEPVMMWAPEIQYIASRDIFLLSVSIPRIPNGGNMQTWIFKGEKPWGPFRNISDRAMHRGIDGFFFEDVDGKVYYLYGRNNIVEMNADLTGFAGEFRELKGLHGIEGMSLVRIGGTYLLSRSDNTGAPGTASYECIYGVSDSVWGPYDYKGSLPHFGHTTMFPGHDGKWRLTMFGSDSHAPVHHGLGIVQFELDAHNGIQLKEDK